MSQRARTRAVSQRARTGAVSHSTAQREAALLDSLFDDAAIFPPGNAPMDQAVRDHVEHCRSWYADYVGPFVCSDDRLAELEQVLGETGLEFFDVTVTVPGGPTTLRRGLDRINESGRMRLIAVETPIHGVAPAQIRDLTRRHGPTIPVYVEVPVTEVTEAVATDLARFGLRAKLRTGGASAAAFPSEKALAAALAAVAVASVAFKCTAGLHGAVRHRDPATGFEHHGFLNIALAVHELRRNGAPEQVEAVLADVDADRIAHLTSELTGTEIAGVRSLFQSFGTCSVDDPLSDLVHMGLVKAP